MTNTATAGDDPESILQSSRDIRHWLRHRHVKMLDSYLHSIRHPTTVHPHSSPRRLEIVMQTVNLCRHFIGSTGWTTPAELLLLIRGVGDEIRAVYSQDPAVVNSVRRILAAIREETTRQEEEQQQDNGGSKNNKGELSSLLLWTLPQNVSSRRRLASVDRHPSLASETEAQQQQQAQRETPMTFPDSYYIKARPHLKAVILEAVQEIYNELADMREAVAEHVSQHLHAGNVVLVCGSGLTLARFLQAAPPTCTLLVVSKDLPLHDCPATVVPIPLAQAVAVASRVHATVISAHAVLANGGVVSTAGAALVTAATAPSHTTLCITGMDALCPQYPHEGQDTLQNWRATTTEVSPLYDYIPPEQVDLFLTNVGSFPPSFIYRLLAENYHADDWKLFR